MARPSRSLFPALWSRKSLLSPRSSSSSGGGSAAPVRTRLSPPRPDCHRQGRPAHLLRDTQERQYPTVCVGRFTASFRISLAALRQLRAEGHRDHHLPDHPLLHHPLGGRAVGHGRRGRRGCPDPPVHRFQPHCRLKLHSPLPTGIERPRCPAHFMQSGWAFSCFTAPRQRPGLVFPAFRAFCAALRRQRGSGRSSSG